MNDVHIYEKGWVCPRCGKVWAPSERECPECNHPKVTVWLQTNRTTAPISPYWCIFPPDWDGRMGTQV
jgi:predicted amidophosphoribosyltransferase